MLLYTRISSPKVPKKRSRMGMAVFRSEAMFILTAFSSSMQNLTNLVVFYSRTGCSQCKAKRKKCDEIRPTCRRCQERGQECIYEPVPPRPKRYRQSIHADSSISTDLMSSQDRATQAPAYYAPTLGSNEDTQGKLADKDQSEEPFITMQEPALCHLQVNQFVTEPTLSLSGFKAAQSSLVSLINSKGFGLAALDGSEYIVQTIEGNEIQNMVNQELVGIPATACDGKQTGAHEICHPSLGLAAPGSTPSFGFNHHPTMFCKLSSRTNRRVLLHHFYHVVSHLTVFHEDCGNPFQQLLLPLCQESQAVTYAVYALASAHLEYRGVSGHERSTYFHNQAIQGLARLIQTGGGINSNELLATIMLLVYYEVLVHKNCSNVVITHLKGAMAIINNGKTINDPTSAFLDRAFLFYDVITALSFGTAPLSSAPKISYHQPLSHLNSDDETSRDTIDNVLGMATSLWPIIHRLSSLVTLKEELNVAMANDEISKAAVLRTKLEVSASVVENALKEWHTILPDDFVPCHCSGEIKSGQSQERSRLESILNNALAYRHSALIYLYRTIYQYPRAHPLVQHHSHVSLTHCASVSNIGPTNALLWPLFVAACEAVSSADRELAQQAFISISRRQGMININHAWTIVNEVWRRIGKSEMLQQQNEITMIGFGNEELWRTVSADMGIVVVFG
ncbi:transcriptional regulatory protein pro-1 [Fusarium denticulatum]|uniref:Transcriptional regulatory protein pro-1 n=1 Tax=Fusarium denticulatum TaxID=48507 RepID=A0A8H5TSH8_9HYPO|nr:transcriptional regulatory protein pro-1 [Fusarium denticulatum]